jgi:hypothetical protein
MSVSASKSALLLSPCLAWARAGARSYDESRVDAEDTEKRDLGIQFHDGQDRYYKKEDYSDKWFNSDVLNWMKLAQEWSRQHLEPRCLEIQSEVYVATNFTTGAIHTDASVRDRKYPEMPGFIPGTADLVCILADGSLLVADWKTGGATGADKQLLTLGYGLRKALPTAEGLPRPVRLAVLYAGPEGVLPYEWEVTDAELEAHAQAMAFQYEDIGKRNEPVLGSHCSQLYCHHLAYCSGVREVAESAAWAAGPNEEKGHGLRMESEAKQALHLPVFQPRFDMTDAPSSDDEAGYVMARITAAKRQLKYYEEGIRRYCSDGGRAVDGDFEFKQTNSGFRWVKRS